MYCLDSWQRMVQSWTNEVLWSNWTSVLALSRLRNTDYTDSSLQKASLCRLLEVLKYENVHISTKPRATTQNAQSIAMAQHGKQTMRWDQTPATVSSGTFRALNKYSSGRVCTSRPAYFVNADPELRAAIKPSSTPFWSPSAKVVKTQRHRHKQSESQSDMWVRNTTTQLQHSHATTGIMKRVSASTLSRKGPKH